MTEFNRLFFEMMDGIGSAGENFDDWNLKQIGLKKKDYVKAPKKVPMVQVPPPDMAKCPNCGYKFHHPNDE